MRRESSVSDRANQRMPVAHFDLVLTRPSSVHRFPFLAAGKYTTSNPPSGARGRLYNAQFIEKATPLLDLMKAVGETHGGKTPTQVALNWLLKHEEVTVIPGAKNSDQVEEIMGAIGWEMDDAEAAEMRKLAMNVPPVQGFPAENI